MDNDQDLDVIRKRLIYRAWHRGTREMDMLIGGFAKSHVPEFSSDELSEFENILNMPDQDLYDWYSGRKQIPENQSGHVMKKFLKHRFSA